MIEFGDYRFDRANQILSRNGEELPLPPRALGVLSRLLDEPGSVVSKQTLLESVWNGAYVTETSLSEAVGLLREALQDAAQEPRYIQTVHRRGYRFIAPVRVPDEPAPPPDPPPAPPPPQRRWTRASAVAAAAALVLLAIGFVAVTGTQPKAVPPLIARFGVEPPASWELYTGAPALAVSPDGRHLVYTGRRGDETALFHRDVSGFDTREIAGTRGGLMPFFSPDGRRVGFYHDGQLVAVPLSGGTALPLFRVLGAFWGASWSKDGSIVYSAGIPAALFRARPGGAAERVTHAQGHGVSHFWPHVLPGGEAVLFTLWSDTLWDSRVEWRSLVTGEQRTVLSGASDCRFAKGMLVCAQAGGTIGAAPFDARTGRLTGAVLPLLRDVQITPSSGFAQLGVGGETLIYLTGAQDYTPRTLQRLVEGTPRPLSAPPRVYRNFAEGPRGQIAVTVLERGRSDVWLLNAASGRSSRLTFEHFNADPVWSPDGRWVAYASKKGTTPYNVYRRRADGSGAAERLVQSSREQSPLAWSPDGRELMLRETRPGSGFDLRVLDVATGKVRPWLTTEVKELEAVWSPDGKWIAYTTGETGRWEVYVRRYPGGEGRWQVSFDGGMYPSWSADGRTIYFQRRLYLEQARELWAVPVDPRGDELSPGAASRVFAGRSLVLGAGGPGGVLLLADAPPPPTPKTVRVVTAWPWVR